MDLRLLAISDTHLGEDVSLLSFPQGRQHLWRTLREEFDHSVDINDKLKINEVVLVGDIPDRALSSTSQIITNTNLFIQMLGSVADIEKGVYVPGNHDHTIWTEYLKCIKDGITHGCTPPSGYEILNQGSPTRYCTGELLTLFFGHPYGASWVDINKKKNFDFYIANPLYATNVGDKTYVFTHGTHFKRELADPKVVQFLKIIFDGFDLDKYSNLNVVTGCDVTSNECNCLEKMEEMVTPFVDSVWVSSRNNPTARSDQFWYLLKMLQGAFSEVIDENVEIRNSPPDSNRFPYDSLNNVSEKRIRRLTKGDNPIDPSVDRWQRYFLPHMLNYLDSWSMLKKDLTFVYGDTHKGGWGELPGESPLPSDGRISLYNCGGWVVHGGEGHPACHIFAIDDDGDEYLLDVSYKDVYVGEAPLLDLASRDFENHQLNTSRIARSFCDVAKLWLR